MKPKMTRNIINSSPSRTSCDSRQAVRTLHPDSEEKYSLVLSPEGVCKTKVQVGPSLFIFRERITSPSPVHRNLSLAQGCPGQQRGSCFNSGAAALKPRTSPDCLMPLNTSSGGHGHVQPRGTHLTSCLGQGHPQAGWKEARPWLDLCTSSTMSTHRAMPLTEESHTHQVGPERERTVGPPKLQHAQGPGPASA